MADEWADSLATAEPGQLVIHRSVNRHGDGDVFVVVKRGRKLITAKEPRGWLETQFRIDGGRINDKYGHSRILTKADAEAETRANSTLAFLQENGIVFNYRRRFTDLQLEQMRTLVESWRAS